VRTRAVSSGAALLGYVAISFAYFGWRVVSHPGRLLVGHDGQSDASTFIWSLAWWPHAILEWTGPFVPHEVYAPTGINLAWVTSVPGLALALAPVTLLFGPSVAYNVAALLLPALSAWTAFLLFRYVTRSTPAALVGGYLYGFSSYMLGHEFASHLNLIGVFVPPLVALVVLRYVRGELGGRGLAWRLGVLVAIQLSISTEVALSVTIALALGLVLAVWLAPATRDRLRSSLVPLVAGYAVAAVLTAPLLYYAVTGEVEGSIDFSPDFGADLLNLVVPTEVTSLGGDTFESVSGGFPGNTAERDSYLGLPLLAIVVLLLLRRPWTPAVRFLLAGFGVATFVSLGTALTVNGHRVLWLPWTLASRTTGLENILPARFALYATLAVAGMVAIWLAAARTSVLRYALAALAVVALVPPFWGRDFLYHPPRHAFFTEHLYEICVPRGDRLLVFPFGRWGESLLWQAESDFWFELAGGTLAHNDTPVDFATDPTISKLIFEFDDPDARPSMDELRALAQRRGIDRVLSVNDGGYPSGEQMWSFGALQELGGVFVSPACGHKALTGDPPLPEG
jgi:hypothetical protein